MKNAGGGNRWVQLIGGFKLVKAVLLFLTAALLPIVGKHQMSFLYGLVAHLNFDPRAQYFQHFIRSFVRLSPKFPLISVGLFVYGAIFSVEGIGLLLRKHWAEYLTIIVTGSFLPLEFYEMLHHKSLTKGVVIALNLAILVYLVWRVRTRRGDARDRSHALAPQSA